MCLLIQGLLNGVLTVIMRLAESGKSSKPKNDFYRFIGPTRELQLITWPLPVDPAAHGVSPDALKTFYAHFFDDFLHFLPSISTFGKLSTFQFEQILKLN